MYTGFPKFLYNIGFFGANRLAGGRFCSFGVAGDLIFALASTVLEIFAKNWNAGYSFFVPLENSPYSLHALASLVRCARLNKKSPRRERVGEWAYSQAGASVHWLDASVHGLPEIFVQ